MTDTITRLLEASEAEPHASPRLINACRSTRAALAQQVEPAPVSWNLKYTDSTPKLNVMHSAFEDWFQQQPFATQEGIKQLCRDSYAAGMGDPLVTYATPQVAQQAEQDEVGINGLTAAETRATMSVAGLSEPTKLTSYERKCFNDWKNP